MNYLTLEQTRFYSFYFCYIKYHIYCGHCLHGSYLFPFTSKPTRKIVFNFQYEMASYFYIFLFCFVFLFFFLTIGHFFLSSFPRNGDQGIPLNAAKFKALFRQVQPAEAIHSKGKGKSIDYPRQQLQEESCLILSLLFERQAYSIRFILDGGK